MRELGSLKVKFYIYNKNKCRETKGSQHNYFSKLILEFTRKGRAIPRQFC